MPDNLPELTHLQFAILDIIGASQITGKHLREALRGKGIKRDGPSFYQMMSRLEEAKYVKGWYEQKIVEGQIIKERNYRILGNGINALRQTRSFYSSRASSGGLTPALA